jgi:hypothetical protein
MKVSWNQNIFPGLIRILSIVDIPRRFMARVIPAAHLTGEPSTP